MGNDWLKSIWWKFTAKVASRFDRRYMQSFAGTFELTRHEPPVYVALGDLCKPGDIVYDVGANVGGLTVPVSRWVGPRGIVCAFEASPRSLPQLVNALACHACFNVRVVHAGVCDETGGSIAIEFGAYPVADRLVLDRANATAKENAARVDRLKLDDFARHFDLWPQVVKMDIEGAEYLALVGAQEIIDRQRPHFILETQPDHQAAVEFLRALDYITIDLATFEEIHSSSDYPASNTVSNVLCYPRERPPHGYQPPIAKSMTLEIGAEDWTAKSDGMYETAVRENLAPGRYIFEVDFECADPQAAMRCGIRQRGQEIMAYTGIGSMLRDSYRHWVAELSSEEPVELFFEPYPQKRRGGSMVTKAAATIHHLPSLPFRVESRF